MTDRAPAVAITVTVPRSRRLVAEQLVLGLVTGGLLGPGLVIEDRRQESIRFVKAGGALRRVPDRGELLLGESSTGGTVVRCRLWCAGMGLRRLLVAASLGALAATVAALALGWLIHVSIPAGVLTAVVVDLAGRRRERSQLRRQLEAFIHNSSYLQAHEEASP